MPEPTNTVVRTDHQTALRSDAEKILHILKLHVDFDDMELQTPEGREIWESYMRATQALCNFFNVDIHAQMLSKE